MDIVQCSLCRVNDRREAQPFMLAKYTMLAKFQTARALAAQQVSFTQNGHFSLMCPNLICHNFVASKSAETELATEAEAETVEPCRI